jgi:hypothetical protein
MKTGQQLLEECSIHANEIRSANPEITLAAAAMMARDRMICELAGNLEKAHRAVNYTLRRLSDDPQVFWHIGLGTETFDRLIKASAAIEGVDPKLHQERILKGCRRGERSEPCTHCGRSHH